MPVQLAAELPIAAVVSYWLFASALMAALELLWLRSTQRQPAAVAGTANLLLAQLRDMLTYGKVKETWSPRQNVPKAWFSHFYVVRSPVRRVLGSRHSELPPAERFLTTGTRALFSQLGCGWHLMCSWLVLDGVWCWIGTHHEHCMRHPPVLSQLIAPPTTLSPPLLQWLPSSTQAYAAASYDEIGSVCLSLLLYGAHVWRRLAEECIVPRQRHRVRDLPTGARMHLAHYLFGMSFCERSAAVPAAALALLATRLTHNPIGHFVPTPVHFCWNCMLLTCCSVLLQMLLGRCL